MKVEIQPDDERLIAANLQSGRFRSVDDVIHFALISLPTLSEEPSNEADGNSRKSLVQLFAESPFAGLAMDFERFPDTSSDL